MKVYALVIEERARRQLKKLPKNVSQKLLVVIKGLATNPLRQSGGWSITGRA